MVGGTIFRPRPSPRNSSPVRRAAQTWISQSPDAAKHPRTQHTDEEYGVGVVAEGQKPLRLLPGQIPGGVQLRCCAGADGIASHQPQQQRGPSAAGQAEQGRHEASHIRRQPLREAQTHQQTGDDHERKQGGDHRPGAEGQGLGRLEPQLSGVRQKPDQDPAQDQAYIRPYPPFHTHHPDTPYAGREAVHAAGQASRGEFPHRVR